MKKGFIKFIHIILLATFLFVHSPAITNATAPVAVVTNTHSSELTWVPAFKALLIGLVVAGTVAFAETLNDDYRDVEQNLEMAGVDINEVNRVSKGGENPFDINDPEWRIVLGLDTGDNFGTDGNSGTGDNEVFADIMADLDPFLDDALDRLRDTGFFDISNHMNGMTEDQFRALLYSVYMRNVFSPISDATTGGFTGLDGEVDFIINPDFPRPGDLITISMRSLGLDLNTANITWWNRGRSIYSGVGATVLENFQIGLDGSPENFIVVIRKKDGGVIEKELMIHPADIDIIYETNTYLPPFYKGKPEYTHNSTIKFIALPSVRDSNGRLMNSSEFTYKWYVNNSVIPENRRAGKNYFYYEDDFSSRELRVSVTIDALNNTFSTSKGMSVTPNDPEVILYEESPLYGTLFNNAVISSIETSSREIELTAVPYFFSKNPNIEFSWALGGRSILNSNQANMTFRAEDDRPLLSELSVSAINSSKVGQTAVRLFSLMVNKR